MRDLYARFTREVLAGRDPRMKGTYDLRERISGLGWFSLSHEGLEMIHFFWVKIKGAIYIIPCSKNELLHVYQIQSNAKVIVCSASYLAF